MLTDRRTQISITCLIQFTVHFWSPQGCAAETATTTPRSLPKEDPRGPV
jgi:hypothetical protein